MTLISLKRLLSKRDTQTLLNALIHIIEAPLAVQDANGLLLLGNCPEHSANRYVVELEGKKLGWVVGNEKTQVVAALLSYLAGRELEKKTLAQETLDRYKEITLLYSISEKITAKLDFRAIVKLVLSEAKRLIPGDCGAVLLLNPEIRQFETIETYGEFNPALTIQAGEGILGAIVSSNTSEIVNQVPSDRRCVAEEKCVQSLVAAPLKSQSCTIGLIVIGNQVPTQYTAADLKLLNILASASASAIENARLHQSKLQEERIKSNLERYISAQVVQAILDAKGEVSLAPVRKNITILFSDIRNFTTQCEELAPELIVGYLNEYFTHMVDEIFNHQGTVNKFVGDMIVALFGAPSYELNTEKRAIETAIAMQKRIQTISTAWIRENFNTGIGISAGEVIVGNIGSPKHTDYTAIGDEVNTASRLQSVATGGQILVSRSVYDATQHLFQFKNIGSIQVKGKRKAIDVFEVVC